MSKPELAIERCPDLFLPDAGLDLLYLCQGPIPLSSALLEQFFRNGILCEKTFGPLELISRKTGIRIRGGQIRAFRRIVQLYQQRPLLNALAGFKRNFRDSSGHFR